MPETMKSICGCCTDNKFSWSWCCSMFMPLQWQLECDFYVLSLTKWFLYLAPADAGVLVVVVGSLRYFSGSG